MNKIQISDIVYNVVYDHYDELLDRLASTSTDVFMTASHIICRILFDRRYSLPEDDQMKYLDTLADIVEERAREYETVIFDL